MKKDKLDREYSKYLG